MSPTGIADQQDFSLGVPLTSLRDGVPLLGRVGEEDVILVLSAGRVFAVSAHCTHYHGPLAEGLVDGETVRCPWHHACFSLKTGEALQAPAFDAIGCWRVECTDDTAYVREKVVAPPVRRAVGSAAAVKSVVIVGGGAAGLAAADMLRRDGYQGELTMISADSTAPCDRPNLSKDFLAGTAPAEWIPLRPDDYYASHDIKLLLNSPVSAIDPRQKVVCVGQGGRIAFDALLIATGADPVRLEIPGATSQVCYLRSFADSQAIVARATGARSVVIVGTSFIGLEVAASLRKRGLEVHLVGREGVPLERVLGPEVGRFIQSLHESKGAIFHFGVTVSRIEGRRVTLSDGTRLDADFVVLGIGVRPSTGLAEQAGLAIDRGVSVDEYLQTSAPAVFAAGDIVRWPDPHTGERIRVEHWVVAERQGQVAAKNMLGQRIPFDAVPFFWSQHHDVTVNYVGHAERWDRIEIEGSLAGADCVVRYRSGERTLAVATIGRDMQSLQAEVLLQRSL